MLIGYKLTRLQKYDSRDRRCLAGQGCQIDGRQGLVIFDKELGESAGTLSREFESSFTSSLGWKGLSRTYWPFHIGQFDSLRHHQSFLKYLHLSLLSHVPENVASGWHETSPVRSTTGSELCSRQGPWGFRWTNGLWVLSRGQQTIDVGLENVSMAGCRLSHRK